MTRPPSLRASDAEREQAVRALREHCVAGRLTLEEFSERMEAAYAATTLEELEGLHEGLPQPAPAPGQRPKRLTLAIFGGFERRGRWLLRRRTNAVSLFGDVDLDLREAQVDGSVVTVLVAAVFGNVDVYVPEGVELDVGGVVVFGHRREWGRDAPGRGPLVRVRAFSLFGTIDVWRVPPGLRGDYRDIVRALKAQQRELPA